MSTASVSDTITRAGDTAVGKTDKTPRPWGTDLLAGEMDNKQQQDSELEQNNRDGESRGEDGARCRVKWSDGGGSLKR